MSLYTNFAILAFSMNVPFVSGQQFDRGVCLATVNATYNSLYTQNPEYFASYTNGSRPFLTLPGCNALCGKRWGPYNDCGPRLLDWIIPAIVLIANLHFVPIGWRRYMTIAHFLGDPIDTIHRQLYLVEGWAENLRIVKKRLSRRVQFRDLDIPEGLATILSAADRLLDPQESSDVLGKVIEWLTFEKNSRFEARFDELKKVAVTLRHLRSHDSRRTGVAILLYIFQFVVVFVYRIGGSPSPSGGRVSPAMMLSWFLPVVLLSNVTGDYGSWRQAQDTIHGFLTKAYHQDDLVSSATVPVQDPIAVDEDLDLVPARVPGQRQTSGSSWWHTLNAQFSELACSGSMRHHHSSSLSRKFVLGLISVFPIALAGATAFRVDFTGPTWFSCRAVAVLSSCAGWFLSCIFTNLAIKHLHIEYRWTVIFFKDVIIGTSIIALIFLSTAGLFNSCYCVSGIIFRGKAKAYVDLNPVSLYPYNNTVYSWTVGIGLFLQMLIVPVLRLWVQREGFRTIWWKIPDESE
ncbi:hypothetical protein GLAREA_03294 [Glarea lozoyensis ATCC 20868]|uniref:Uncharacterized protein n=1 Tax=Glarea lozoyensis (strain ATCC 20868 / MF5171) TaxID=1116229 RepID=S3CQJ3_GLAL2|nr:uncharacterized protein GLAREA_03294 [Glarea lozoyensis ATCC 20868]EPE27379.1 hypothetical protein GLAREA_03294 [Glarea lozoyensis ATCC 20868]